MSGGKGGSQTTQTEIPEWAEEATIANLGRAAQAQQVGYMPYMGPDLAAFNPAQTQAMQQTIDAAQAFGLAAPSAPLEGMPQPQEFAGGMMGYSSFPLFEQAQMELAARNPQQQAAYDALFGNTMPTTTASSVFDDNNIVMGRNMGRYS